MVKKYAGLGLGYTITEVMVTVAILGAIASVSAPLMMQAQRFFLLSNTRMELQREARAAMYVITRSLRQGQQNSIVIDSVAGQPYYSRITFTKQQGTTVTYYQNGNSLMEQVGNNTTTLTKHLQFVSFFFPRTDDLAMVSVSMTLQEATYDGQTKALHMASENVQVMN